MKDQIDWKEKVFSPHKMIERAVVLSMNRVEEAAEKRPEFNKEQTHYHDVGPHFDNECATLMNLLNARQNEQRTAIKASDPKPR